MTFNRAPSRCKHCKVKFAPEERGQRLHEACVDPWMVVFREQQKRKAMTKRRAQDRVKREEQKTLPTLFKEARAAFHKWIRTRDAADGCISCGKPPGDMTQLHAGRDAGHFRSVGTAGHLRFHEDNVHGQCVECNQFKAGNVIAYRARLIEKIGLERVEALEADNAPHKWTREEVRGIRDDYRARLKATKAKGDA